MTFAQLVQTVQRGGPVPAGTSLPQPRVLVRSAEGYVPRSDAHASPRSPHLSDSDVAAIIRGAAGSGQA